ncbi:GNAT family N-acetyltransferase [Pseudoduganella plicata]|nr:GNAT family N-acetyltransferase [Pseudoduganella plicata]QBQ39188.1 GNAT family N-acetyltransferase [Pseudoduganella plicata]
MTAHPDYRILTVARLEHAALAAGDFSFDVTAVAAPPFGADDIDTIVPVTRYRKSYGEHVEDLVPQEDGALFAACANDALCGYLAVTRDWNGFALVDDVAVARRSRGAGLGRALMDAAREWAMSAGLAGLRLETQSTNVPACRFYRRYGFRLAGHDRMLYAAVPGLAHEVALFWYLVFADGDRRQAASPEGPVR